LTGTVSLWDEPNQAEHAAGSPTTGDQQAPVSFGRPPQHRPGRARRRPARPLPAVV